MRVGEEWEYWQGRVWGVGREWEGSGSISKGEVGVWGEGGRGERVSERESVEVWEESGSVGMGMQGCGYSLLIAHLKESSVVP